LGVLLQERRCPYGAQPRRGTLHQTCLAHLARDVAYGLEASEDPVPFRLKLWFDRVFSLAALEQLSKYR
jgi:transposase